MKYILVADDEPMNLEIMKIILMDEYEIQCADNGIDCLKSIAERKPDLLLLDYSMPGMNGIDVCKNLRANSETKDIPIIMVSGFASDTNINAGLEAGVNEYMTKPYKPNELLDAVARYI